MFLLTDTPAAAGDFRPGASWRRADFDELPTGLARAWRVVAGDAVPWRPDASGAGDDRGAAPSGRTLLLVDRAQGSQFEALRAALREGDGWGDVASLALTGSGFRGQRSRSWTALRGNLHLCVVARLDLPAASLQAALTALPAVATARAVERITQGTVRPGIKWVNDLLVDGAKVAGVLSATQVHGERVTHALFGIGVNVARAPTLATASATAPGCLADADPTLASALPALTVAVLHEVDTALDAVRCGDADGLVADYRRRALFIGRRVAIWPTDADDVSHHEPLVRGRVSGLLDDLGLLLEGRDEPIRTGRMTFLSEGA